MLAALDLLAITNLLNYFGRQDEVDKVQVSPILIKKGEETKVALYGMGNMRDERLNRMWQGKKVRFLRPEREEGQDEDNENDDDDDGAGGDKSGWFNIFALHQNRDLGRGTKNCVHESMIPEWMDLVIWGHEHECLIQPSESVVGTFRITQPGSSVATSLTEGEAATKHVGILDIRGPQFRMSSVPLKQVRRFAVGSIVLKDHSHGLDVEDPHIDDAMGKLLEEQVDRLVREARALLIQENADGEGESGLEEDDGDRDEEARGGAVKRKRFKVDKPQQVLVRLKVEHSGFSTLNNQRFGSRFVKEVANPSDILCFHRKRSKDGPKESIAKGNRTNANSLSEPSYPDELNAINMENIMKDTLETTDKKLQILDEEKLGFAVEDFVSKEQKQAFLETVDKIVTVQQKRLVKRGLSIMNSSRGGDADSAVGNVENKVTTANAVREVCHAESQKLRDDDDMMDIEEEPSPKRNGKRTKSVTARERRPRSSKSNSDDDIVDGEDDDETNGNYNHEGKRAKLKGQARRRNQRIWQTTQRHSPTDSDINDEEEITVVRKQQQQQKKPSLRERKTRQAACSQNRYTFNEDDDDDFINDNQDSSSEVEMVANSSRKTKGGSTTTPNRAKRQRGVVSSSQTTASSSFASSRRKITPARSRKAVSYFGGSDDDDDDDDLDDVGGKEGLSMGTGWGTASSQPSIKRTRRR